MKNLSDCDYCRVIGDKGGNYILGWIGSRPSPFQSPDFEQFTKADPYAVCRAAGFPPRPEYQGQYMRKIEFMRGCANG